MDSPKYCCQLGIAAFSIAAKDSLIALELLFSTPGKQPCHGVDKDTGSQFPSAEHIVTNGELFVHQTLSHPFIHTFIPATNQNGLIQRGKLRGHALLKPFALRRE